MDLCHFLPQHGVFLNHWLCALGFMLYRVVTRTGLCVGVGCESVFLCICLYINVSVCISVSMSVYVFVCLHVCLCVYVWWTWNKFHILFSQFISVYSANTYQAFLVGPRSLKVYFHSHSYGGLWFRKVILFFKTSYPRLTGLRGLFIGIFSPERQPSFPDPGSECRLVSSLSLLCLHT